jgi:phosphoglucomutase
MHMQAHEPENLLAEARGSGAVSTAALANLVDWLQDPTFVEFAPEIAALITQREWSELDDAFYRSLPIGTGGIRGKLGVGPNRVNTRTIGTAARALCQFIEGFPNPPDAAWVLKAKESGVVVGHEARKHSRAFATMCCEVFARNGIHSYLFDDLRSTPEVSFAVRELRATAGVQITASHNPRTDNGFKFYWSKGGQVIPPDDAKFMDLVANVKGIERMPFDEATQKGLIEIIGPEMDEAYLKRVVALSVESERSAHVVFSPMHGAGTKNVLPVLQRANVKVSTVALQERPDQEFPSAAGDIINPEYREVMRIPVQEAELVGADLAICSDPDADRVGVAARVRPDRRELKLLRGDDLGAALTHYLLERRRELGALTSSDLILETQVTTSLIADIARSFGVQARSDLLVGFKWIAQEIEQTHGSNQEAFIFAAEESIGYLAGNFVRDKDASIAALLATDMASWLKLRNETIWSYLNGIYTRFGYYRNLQYLFELPGKTGQDVMREVMLGFRRDPLKALAGKAVIRQEDRLLDSFDPDTYQLGNGADVITFVLSHDARDRVSMRPSGTEPKLKYYIQRYVPAGDSLEAAKDVADNEALALAYDVGKQSGERLSGEMKREWSLAMTRLV